MNRTNVISAVVALLLLSLTAWLVVNWWPKSTSDLEPAESEDAPQEVSPVISLTSAKSAIAKIVTLPADRQNLAVTRTLPGRFAYDDRRHVAVRAATDSVLDAVLVKPGDKVQKGTKIAVLRSPAIGEARSSVLTRRSEWQLAETERMWRKTICEGVKTLVQQIRDGNPIEQIKVEIDDSTLGKYRGELLSLYSKTRLDSQLVASASSSSGALTGRVIRQRQSEMERSQAALSALMEQSLFETEQACKTATAKFDTARRNLLVAQQTLATVLGIPGDRARNLEVDDDETDLARMDVIAPLTGTVERRVYSPTERVSAGGEMFVIADTSKLWVEADIRGRDWTALSVGQGDEVVVTTPNQPNEKFTGRVFYVGREVDSLSGAIPVVIEIANSENRFRPGQFARVEVPIDQIQDTLAVPESAVVDLNGQSSVFVAEKDGYRPVSVKIGVSAGGMVEIREGITVGQPIVVEGAFTLKSELLLEGEE